MNTVSHPTRKFPLLLRREFWEHKGGFLWAPLVAGGIFVLLSLMGFGDGEMAARRATGNFQVEGSAVQINGLDLSAVTADMDAEQLQHLGQGVDLSLLMASAWPLIALAFVVFFYCLGALYHDRKDRSVLFWKSLPLSDTQTVLSKAASALLVAPVIATLAALATMIGFLLVASVMVMIHGGNPVELLWGPGSPLLLVGEVLAWGVASRSTAAGTVQAWMNSPGHRRILLSRRYGQIGIGLQAGTPFDAYPAGLTAAALFGRRNCG